MSTLPDIPREIVEALENRLVVPFVGAGVSVNVKGDGKKLFPNWKELFERMIGEGVGGGDGQAAADALRSQGLCKERGVRRAGTVAGERVGRLDHSLLGPCYWGMPGYSFCWAGRLGELPPCHWPVSLWRLAMRLGSWMSFIRGCGWGRARRLWRVGRGCGFRRPRVDTPDWRPGQSPIVIGASRSQ